MSGFCENCSACWSDEEGSCMLCAVLHDDCPEDVEDDNGDDFEPLPEAL